MNKELSKKHLYIGSAIIVTIGMLIIKVLASAVNYTVTAVLL